MKKIVSYPTNDNGFANFIDYKELIELQSQLVKMQDQKPIVKISRKVSLRNESQKNNAVLKRSFTRTTNK